MMKIYSFCVIPTDKMYGKNPNVYGKNSRKFRIFGSNVVVVFFKHLGNSLDEFRMSSKLSK